MTINGEAAGKLLSEVCGAQRVHGTQLLSSRLSSDRQCACAVQAQEVTISLR